MRSLRPFPYLFKRLAITPASASLSASRRGTAAANRWEWPFEYLLQRLAKPIPWRRRRVANMQGGDTHSPPIFVEFAKRIGVAESRIDKLLHPFFGNQAVIEGLVRRSFLSDADKRGYMLMYGTKRYYLISKMG